jgi:hypothetical protein
MTFGSAATLVLMGIAAAIFLGGLVGTLLAFWLIGGGLVVATSLAFLEVGLSEDQAREQEWRRANRVDHARQLMQRRRGQRLRLK